MPVGIAVVVVVLIGVLVAIGVGQMRDSNTEKVDGLRNHVNRRVVIITETGGQLRMPHPISGVLRDVTKGHVVIEDKSGRARNIPIAGVRGLEDAGGRTIANWW